MRRCVGSCTSRFVLPLCILRSFHDFWSSGPGRTLQNPSSICFSCRALHWRSSRAATMRNAERCLSPWAGRLGPTLEGSFSAVSKPNFARKYAFEGSRRDLHNALLCIASSRSGKLCNLNFLVKNCQASAKFCKIEQVCFATILKIITKYFRIAFCNVRSTF